MGTNNRQARWWNPKGGHGGPPVVFVAALASALALRCASVEPDRLYRPVVTQAGGAGGFQTVFSGGWPAAQGGFAFQIVSGTGGLRDAGRTYPCTLETTERDCPPPPPTCALGPLVAFYTDPVCVQGACQWTRHTGVCANGCSNGGCVASRADAHAEPLDSGVQCTPGDASACQLPPSECLDSRNLLYFTNSRCADGTCRFDALVEDCGQVACRAGGCFRAVTH